MKKSMAIFSCSAVLLFSCFLAGCAANPTARWYQAQDTLNHTRAAILAQHQAGNISDADLVRMDQFEKAARAALTQAKVKIDAGDAADAGDYLNVVERVLNRLIASLKATHPAHSPLTGQKDLSHGSSGNS